MSIDINGLTSAKVHSLQNDNQQKTAVEQQPAAPPTAKSSATDTVSLSENARHLDKLNDVAVSAPVVDTKRVEQVKLAINNGSYKVDAEQVADKLMQFENLLKP